MPITPEQKQAITDGVVVDLLNKPEVIIVPATGEYSGQERLSACIDTRNTRFADDITSRMYDFGIAQSHDKDYRSDPSPLYSNAGGGGDTICE